MKETNALTKIIINTLNETLCKNGYTAFFKAAIFTLGLSFISMFQAGSFLYERDIDAHKSAYEIEEISGVSIKETNCNTLKTHYTECRIAKHKYETLDSSLGVLDLIATTSLRLGYCLLAISFVLFLASPTYKRIELTKPHFEKINRFKQFKISKKTERKFSSRDSANPTPLKAATCGTQKV